MKETMKAEVAELLAEMRKRSVTGTGITLSAGSNGLLVAAFDAMQAELDSRKWTSSNTPKKAYLVGTFEQYEAGFTPYFAFLNKALADVFLTEAIAFYATKPDYSDTDEFWQLLTEWHNSTREKFGHMLLGDDELVIHEIELKANESERKWISVKDRLPEEVGFYLVFTDIGKVFECRYYCDQFIESYVEWQEVTHWLPLPEPPNAIKTLWAVNIPEEPDSEELLFAATSKEHAQSIVSRLHNEIFETYPTLGEPIADAIYVAEWQESAEEHAESLATKWWEHTTFLGAE